MMVIISLPIGMILKVRNSVVILAITDLVEDHEGNIWIATQNGLNRYERKTGTFTRYAHDNHNINSLSNNIINRLALKIDGTLLIATQNGGLDFFDISKKHFTHRYSDKGAGDY